MKDGYYLSCYAEVNPLAHVHGFAQRHDHNVSLWRKVGRRVELVHYWELERVTGLKQHRLAFYDADQGRAVIDRLLAPHGLRVADMQEVWGTPGLQTVDDYHSVCDLPDYSYHCVAHLFSGLLLDTEAFHAGDVLAIAVDAGSDTVIDPDATAKYQFAGCVSRGGRVRYFPVSTPAPLWAKAAERYGQREGTLMALAAASTSLAWAEAPPPPDLTWFDFLALGGWFEAVERGAFGLTPTDAGGRFNGFDPAFGERENAVSMVMKEVQAASQRMMDDVVGRAVREHGLDPSRTHLAVAGGFALNCPTNSYLMAKYGFKNFLAPPCVNDGGQSLGIALYAFHKKLGRFDFRLPHAYFGDAAGDPARVLTGDEFGPFVAGVSDFDPGRAARDLRGGPVVWVEGRAEVGPRALGARSVLADPTTTASRDALNRIKQRQWWRPVAPIILEEEAGAWFVDGGPSPYMLHTRAVRPEKASAVPAVVHRDGTARLQTLGPDSPLEQLHGVLAAFRRETGVPLLCNTSLNDHGEPIVNRLEEALTFALRKGIETLYVDGVRVALKNHPGFTASAPRPRPLAIGTWPETPADAASRWNPFGADRDHVVYGILLGLPPSNFSTRDGIADLRRRVATPPPGERGGR